MTLSFKSWRSYWDFESYVHNESRYHWDTDIEDFLDAIRGTSVFYRRKIEAGAIFWRAQHGYELQPEHRGGIHKFDVPVPYPPSRMLPLDNLASEGRLNPKGLPCLYMATDLATCVAEMRPWPGQILR